MERVVYQQMAELDDRHWWYRARRRIIADLIRREAHLPPDAEEDDEFNLVDNYVSADLDALEGSEEFDFATEAKVRPRMTMSFASDHCST